MVLNRRYDAVIFDLDGTLLNTSEDICDSMNFALSKRGMPTYTPAEIIRMVGSGVRVMAQRASAGVVDADIDGIVADYMDEYKKRLMIKTRPYPGLPELAAGLKARGFKTGVLSNKPERDTKTLIYTLFGEDVFDAVVGQREGMPTKPDPSGARLLLEQLGVPSGRALLAGDSDVDMRTAANAGIDAVAVLWGYRRRDELAAAGAVRFAQTAKELLEHIEKG